MFLFGDQRCVDVGIDFASSKQRSRKCLSDLLCGQAHNGFQQFLFLEFGQPQVGFTLVLSLDEQFSQFFTQLFESRQRQFERHGIPLQLDRYMRLWPHQQNGFVLFHQRRNDVAQPPHDERVVQKWMEVFQQEDVIARVVGDLLQEITRVAVVTRLNIQWRRGTGGRRPDHEASFDIECQRGQFRLPAILFVSCQKEQREVALDPFPQNVDDVGRAHGPWYRSNYRRWLKVPNDCAGGPLYFIHSRVRSVSPETHRQQTMTRKPTDDLPEPNLADSSNHEVGDSALGDRPAKPSVSPNDLAKRRRQRFLIWLITSLVIALVTGLLLGEVPVRFRLLGLLAVAQGGVVGAVLGRVAISLKMHSLRAGRQGAFAGGMASVAVTSILWWQAWAAQMTLPKNPQPDAAMAAQMLAQMSKPEDGNAEQHQAYEETRQQLQQFLDTVSASPEVGFDDWLAHRVSALSGRNRVCMARRSGRQHSLLLRMPELAPSDSVSSFRGPAAGSVEVDDFRSGLGIDRGSHRRTDRLRLRCSSICEPESGNIESDAQATDFR